MLVNGKFVKEPPPRIGVHYARDVYRRSVSVEESFVQDVLLGHMPYTTSFWKQLVAKVLAV